MVVIYFLEHCKIGNYLQTIYSFLSFWFSGNKPIFFCMTKYKKKKFIYLQSQQIYFNYKLGLQSDIYVTKKKVFKLKNIP
jgi:hypothetical protein